MVAPPPLVLSIPPNKSLKVNLILAPDLMSALVMQSVISYSQALFSFAVAVRSLKASLSSTVYSPFHHKREAQPEENPGRSNDPTI